MDQFNIDQRWNELVPNAALGFHALRMSNECIPNLYLGIDKHQNRCLILSLASGTHPLYSDSIREYISLEYYDQTRHIIIRLLNRNFTDLFNDLIVSIHEHIKFIQSDLDSAQKFIQLYHKWGEFFNTQARNLSREEIQGIYGELIVLNLLISSSIPSTINETIDSWQGPYNKAHDFELSSMDIEVKTIELHHNEVKISSEYQLESDHGKALELHLVSVEFNTLDSLNIRQLVHCVTDNIIEKGGDTLRLIRALSKLSVSLSDIDKYDNYRFEVKKITRYNCLADNFPRLTKSNIPIEIYSVKYRLKINSLLHFIIEDRLY